MRNKDKPKKISLFLPDLRIGGAEHLTITLANDWGNKGYEIDLVILHQEISDDSLHSFVSPSVNIVNLNTKRFIFSIIPLASYFRKAKPNFSIAAMWPLTVVSVSGLGDLSQVRS